MIFFLLITRSLGTAYKLMIPCNLVQSLVAFAKSMSTFQESQKLRVDYLHQAKEAGLLLIDVQRIFKDGGYCKTNPLVVGDRSYASYSDLMKDFAWVYTQLIGPIPEGLEPFFTESHAAKCRSLASNWDVACEIVDFFHPKNAYRLSKTLEIISWYKQKVADNPGEDRSTFTCEKYWEWLNAKREAARQAKAEREKQENELRWSYNELKLHYDTVTAKLEELSAENRQLKQELEQTKQLLRQPVFA